MPVVKLLTEERIGSCSISERSVLRILSVGPLLLMLCHLPFLLCAVLNYQGSGAGVSMVVGQGAPQ